MAGGTLFLRGGGGISLGVGGGGGGDPIEEDIPGQLGIRYGLPNAKTTSGVILNSEGQVVRRLWGGRLQPEGQYTEIWDGKDDDGNTLDQDDYTPAVLAHNHDYIVNRLKNPSAKTGPGQFAQFRVPIEFILDGNDESILCSPAYTESTLWLWQQLFTEPGIWRDKVRSSSTLEWVPHTMCSDGTTTFMVMRKLSAPRDVIVVKITLATMTLATWSGLTPDGYSIYSANGPSGSNYNGYALPLGTEGSENSETYTPRKMAVQKTGNALAITQPGQSKVLTVHKGTGATIFSPIVSLTNPSCVAWNTDEDVLWVSDDAGLYPYIKGDWLASGSAATVGDVNGALGYDGAIMDLKCDVGNNIIGVVYGGPSSHMQVVPIDGDDGTAAGTPFGQALGYASDTGWAEDKLHFGSNWVWYIKASTNTSGPPGNIDFYADGSLLIHHAALRRLIKVSNPWGTPSIEVLHEWNTSYGLAVCRTDPSRIFAPGWIELSRDYNTDLVEGSFDGYAIEAFYGYSLYDTNGPSSLGDAYEVFEDDGHTYVISGTPTGLYELTSSGMREITTGAYANFYNVHIAANLDKYRYVQSGNKIVRNAYLGLDGSNNPTWDTDEDYVSLPGTQPIPNISTQRHPIYVLSDGSVIVLGGQEPATEGTYHMMRIASDGTVLWRAIPELTESIPFPWDGHGTIYGNNPPGGLAVSEDDDLIIVSWPGEGYAAGQASAHLLFNLDGIFIEKIGNSGEVSFIGTDYPLPMQSGVAHATALASVNGIPHYLYNGENRQSAITEVRIEGPRQVLSDTVPLGTHVNLGNFDADAYAPDLIGAVSESDTFASLSGWTGTSNFETITGGARAKSSVHQYNPLFAAIMYRSGSYADGMEFLDIPNPFNGQGALNNYSDDIVAYWGLVGRYNSGTGVRIMAHAHFLYFEGHDGATEHGYFIISLGAVNAANYFFNLGCEYIYWLPSTRDHDYKLGFIYAGASPTRLCVQFWDATTGLPVMKPMQTTLALPEFQDAGAKGIALCGLSQITGWQTRIGSWTKEKPPFLASIA